MYVDGFVVPVPTKNIRKYLSGSRRAGRIFKRHGALEYREAVGDDLTADPKMGMGFKKAARLKRGETALFSWIVYKSKGHRNAVNKKVMKDPKLLAMMQEPDAMPFDYRRMAYGGFRIAVDL